jgi:type II secretory pathway component PulK
MIRFCQRLHDLPRILNALPGQADNAGQHRREFDVGVLQRLLQALDVAGLLADQLFARA